MRAAHLSLAILLTAAMVLSAGRLRAARDRPYDVDVVPTATASRWLSFGHPLTAANFNWLKAVQYIGEPRAKERGWGKLYPLVDLVTDLDPGHGYAYQVGGVILASEGLVAESNLLLEKGTRNVDRYILPYLRAFNAFYHQGDWEAAGRWAEISAKTPGAPAHVRQNVLAYYVKGRRAEAAIHFLEDAYREAEDDETRKALEGQLKQAILEKNAGQVDDAVNAWVKTHYLPPVSLGLLVLEGYIDRIPDDPFGGQLVLGPDGRARSSVHEFRFSQAPKDTELTEPKLGHAGDTRR